MADKTFEMDCLKTIMNIPPKGGFANSIYEQIKNGIPFPMERPDFAVLSSSRIIGIEHFLSDILLGHKDSKPYSIERFSKRQKHYVNERYENTEKLMEDIQSGKASEIISELINSEYYCGSFFSYDAFIHNLERVTKNHYQNLKDYKENVKESSIDLKMGLLIEIPYPESNNGIYRLRSWYTDEWFKKKIKTVPITEDMIRIVRSLKELDFVILCLRPYYSKPDESNTDVFYLNPNDVLNTMDEQDIHIFLEFDYIEKQKIFVDIYIE